MKVLFLTQGTTVPSARFRVHQFEDAFRARGVDVEIRPAYGDAYNRIAAQGGAGAAGYKLAARALRVLRSLDARRFDVVFVQRPALPFSALPEQLLRRLHRSIVFDVDDSIFAGIDGQVDPTRMQTFLSAAHAADVVIAGNAFLREQLSEHPDVRVIPTVVDTDKYTPGPGAGDGHFRVGWMGTAGNFKYLQDYVEPVTAFLQKRPQARCRIVSNAEFEPLSGHPQVEQVRWSAEREIRLLRSFDVGLMPLRDSLHSRGKCAFKLLQYMAVGRPWIASPVGANIDVVGTPPTGFLADGSEVHARLDQLYDDERLRARMGEDARGRVVGCYSVGAVVDRYVDLFCELATRR